MDQQNKKLERYQKLTKSKPIEIINFRGQTLYRTSPSNPYIPLTSSDFARIAYSLFPSILKAHIADLEHQVRATAPDLTPTSHLIGFPDGSVWDARTATISTTTPAPQHVYQAALTPDPAQAPAALEYLKTLANGSLPLAHDYLQGLAPLFLTRRPAGIVWFVGGGANGKSSLMNAVYRIIGAHLTSMSVAAIEDGRDAPRLNGMLGNVCRESSESRVEDTERYKALGTHEGFYVHKFHSQDSVYVSGDIHTIFNANNIPVFSDKTEGARRRTLIIPFPAHFKDDPTFEERTFTTPFLQGLLYLILEAAKRIRDNHYQYSFSEEALSAKEDYDHDVNSAEAFLDHLRDNKVKAFTNYNHLKMAYENWCMNEGYIPLGVTNLKRVMVNHAHATRRAVRTGDQVSNWYYIDGSTAPPSALVQLDNGLSVGLRREDDTTEHQPAAHSAPASPAKKSPAQSELSKDW